MKRTLRATQGCVRQAGGTCAEHREGAELDGVVQLRPGASAAEERGGVERRAGAVGSGVAQGSAGAETGDDEVAGTGRAGVHRISKDYFADWRRFAGRLVSNVKISHLRLSDGTRKQRSRPSKEYRLDVISRFIWIADADL